MYMRYILNVLKTVGIILGANFTPGKAI
jgi:hypothetical protein